MAALANPTTDTGSDQRAWRAGGVLSDPVVYSLPFLMI
jgi:hypothetical protein